MLKPASHADSLALADVLVGAVTLKPASHADSLALADVLVGAVTLKPSFARIACRLDRRPAD
jgi:hypothetical protein